MILNLETCTVAGAYASVNPGSIPPPPDPSHHAYLNEAIRHVSSKYSGPTEFISVSRNLLRCLHRALKSESTSSIAVMYIILFSSAVIA